LYLARDAISPGVRDSAACREVSARYNFLLAPRGETGPPRNVTHRFAFSFQFVKETAMLKWAAIFAVIALVCAALGFGGLAGAAMGIAKFLFWCAVVIALIFVVLGVTVYKKIT
jgi:uncharacterized membrane protein YtjA (UPF0391 family)